MNHSGTPTASAAVPARRDLLRVVAGAIVVGLPVSLIAVAFLSVVDGVQEWVWRDLPADAGFAVAPWWWPLPWLLLAGLLVGSAVAWLPGRGGHVAADGISGSPVAISALPGVAVAALAGLPLGVVLGPEAPLIALGGGLAVLIARGVRLSPGGDLELLIGVAGSAAAVAVILGNPLTAVVLLVEAAALARRPVIAVIIPALLGVGLGALTFSGLGDTAGIAGQSLQLVDLDEVARPELADLLYAVPLGAVAAIVMAAVFGAGRRVAHRFAGLPSAMIVPSTMLAGLVVGGFAAAYALIADGDPFDVASSGTETLSRITSDPDTWSTGALVALLLFKAAAYAVSLGSFRGGPIFPAIMLGGTLGVLLAPLPGLGLTGGVAIGMAAFSTAAMRMPLSAVALTLLLFGPDAADVVPEVAVAAVSAYLLQIALDRRASGAAPPIPAEAQPRPGDRPTTRRP